MDMFKKYNRFWKIDWGLRLLNEDGTSEYGYAKIIEGLHPNIKSWVWEEEDDYQGDFYGLGLDDKKHYCFISGSFGSCSGCDWLQSIDSVEEALKFLSHYKKVVIKKESKKLMEKYLLKELQNAYWTTGIHNLLAKIDSLQSIVG